MMPYWAILILALVFAWPPAAGIVAAVWFLLWVGTWILRGINGALDDVDRNLRR